MKKLFVFSLALSLIFPITACQKNQTDSDTAKIQESIDKIKAKIQDDLSTEKENDKKESN